MDLRQLEYFKTIVEEGTISKAAKVLHMAQPPLSMQLKALETELGVKLVERLPRHIALTKEGELFYKRTLQILELCKQTKKEVVDQMYYKTIHIGVTSSNVGMLPACLTKFHQHYPHILFEIHEGDTYAMIDLIKSHIIDVAIVRSPFDSTQLNFQYLSSEPIIAVGSKDYLYDKEIMDIQDLKDVPIILYRRYEQLIMDTFMNHHISPTIICKNDDCRTSLLWANLHLGVALVPQSAMHLFTFSKDIKKVPLMQKELYTSVSVIWRQDQALTPMIQDLLELFTLFYNDAK